MPSKKKKYNARFPPARIKKIMQVDDDVGKVAAAVPVIISRALELFVDNLLNKANEVTFRRCARTLTPSHIKFCIGSETRFDFLKDLVAGVADLQGDSDELPLLPPPQPLPVTTTAVIPAEQPPVLPALKESSANGDRKRPLTLPKQVSTTGKRGRPRKNPLPASNPTLKEADPVKKEPKKRGRKKRQRVEDRFVDDVVDDNRSTPFDNESDVSADEEIVSENGQHKNSSNGSTQPVTSLKSSLSLVESAKYFKPDRAAFNRSMSYSTPSTTFVQRSEHVINSNGITFSLSYPMPLSPTLPPLPNLPGASSVSSTAAASNLLPKFSLASAGLGQLNGSLGGKPSSTSTSSAPATSWGLHAEIDEDYDA